MKLIPAILTLSILGIVSPVAGAGQQGLGNELAHKARPVLALTATGLVLADAGTNEIEKLPVTQKVKYDAAYSVCQAAVPVGHRDFSLANGVGPSSVILGYFMSRGETYDIMSWKKTLVENPKHGKLILQPTGGFFYFPNEGYLGPDQLTWVVEAQGKIFKVIETVWVENTAPENGGCPADYKLPPANGGNVKHGALNIIELSASEAIDVVSRAQ